MTKKTATLLILLVSFLFVGAQESSSKINEYISRARIDWEVPGMAVAIVKDGEVIFSKGYGTKKNGVDDPVDQNTLFAIASNTKAFVSSALGVLVDRNELSWSDKVRDHLPYFELYDPYVTQETTIIDLLCHRVGLGTFSGDVIWYKSDLTAENVLKRVKYIPQDYGFRNGYGYSNLMFIAAGEVISKVTGQEWNHFIRQTFFIPLKMERTVTSTNNLDKLGNYAIPHKKMNDRETSIPWVNWDNMGAAGGIISSAADMARWIGFQLNNGIMEDDTLLNPATQNLLWTPHNNHVVSLRARENIPGRHFNGYGLGWGLFDYYGRKVITHSGGYDGMYSRVALIPDENLGFVVLTNSMSRITSVMLYYLINAFIEEDNRDWSSYYLNIDSLSRPYEEERIERRREARVDGTLPTLELKSYAGTYNDDMYGEIYITEENDLLKLKFSNAPALNATLKHWHYDTFEIIWDNVHAWFDFGTLKFELDNNLLVKGLSFDVPNDDIFFHEIQAKKE